MLLLRPRQTFNDWVVECRAVQRVPKADRWKRDAIDMFRATRWANPAPAFDVAVSVVLPGRTTPSCSSTTCAPRSVYIRTENLPKSGRTAGCRRCTWKRNGEPAKGIPHTPACRDKNQQAMKDAGDERIFAVEARLNQYPCRGDEASEAELLAEEQCRAGSPAPTVPEAPAMNLAVVTADDASDGDNNRADGDCPDAAGDSSNQPIAHCRWKGQWRNAWCSSLSRLCGRLEIRGTATPP